MNFSSLFKTLSLTNFLRKRLSPDFFWRYQKLRQKLEKCRVYFINNIYFLTFLGFGLSAWADIIEGREIKPEYAFAYSVWAAYPLLMLLGLRYPKKIIPVLIAQLFYIFAWLIIFALPLWRTNSLDALSKDNITTFFFAILMDILAAPGVFVMLNNLRKTAVEPQNRPL